MTERITIDASAWTGRGEYADDFRICIAPPRKVWRWWRKHLTRLPIPALLIRSGPMDWGNHRGFFVGFMLCPWRAEIYIPWLVSSETHYREL